jgi:hypothetical protein
MLNKMVLQDGNGKVFASIIEQQEYLINRPFIHPEVDVKIEMVD